MPLDDLKDVYTDQIQDLHSACEQSLGMTGELGAAAHDKELSEALIAGANGIANGLDRLKSLCADHGVDPEATHCKAMQGLVREARDHVLNAEFGDNATRDAMIITQYQRMVHYAIAGYGCLLAFAKRLKLDEDGAALEALLEHTYSGDRHMTSIATRGGVNADAA